MSKSFGFVFVSCAVYATTVTWYIMAVFDKLGHGSLKNRGLCEGLETKLACKAYTVLSRCIFLHVSYIVTCI